MADFDVDALRRLLEQSQGLGQSDGSLVDATQPSPEENYTPDIMAADPDLTDDTTWDTFTQGFNQPKPSDADFQEVADNSNDRVTDRSGVGNTSDAGSNQANLSDFSDATGDSGTGAKGFNPADALQYGTYRGRPVTDESDPGFSDRMGKLTDYREGLLSQNDQRASQLRGISTQLASIGQTHASAGDIHGPDMSSYINAYNRENTTQNDDNKMRITGAEKDTDRVSEFVRKAFEDTRTLEQQDYSRGQDVIKNKRADAELDIQRKNQQLQQQRFNRERFSMLPGVLTADGKPVFIDKDSVQDGGIPRVMDADGNPVKDLRSLRQLNQKPSVVTTQQGVFTMGPDGTLTRMVDPETGQPLTGKTTGTGQGTPITGADGKLYVRDPTDPTKTVPLTGPDGQQLSGKGTAGSLHIKDTPEGPVIVGADGVARPVVDQNGRRVPPATNTGDYAVSYAYDADGKMYQIRTNKRTGERTTEPVTTGGAGPTGPGTTPDASGASPGAMPGPSGGLYHTPPKPDHQDPVVKADESAQADLGKSASGATSVIDTARQIAQLSAQINKDGVIGTGPWNGVATGLGGIIKSLPGGFDPLKAGDRQKLNYLVSQELADQIQTMRGMGQLSDNDVKMLRQRLATGDYSDEALQAITRDVQTVAQYNQRKYAEWRQVKQANPRANFTDWSIGYDGQHHDAEVHMQSAVTPQNKPAPTAPSTGSSGRSVVDTPLGKAEDQGDGTYKVIEGPNAGRFIRPKSGS